MTGNGRSGRGLFSSIRKAAVATATAFSLALGGMAVPAVSDHAAEVALPSAAADENLKKNPDFVQSKPVKVQQNPNTKRNETVRRVQWKYAHPNSNAPLPYYGIYTITPKWTGKGPLPSLGKVRVRQMRGTENQVHDWGLFDLSIVNNGTSYQLDLSSQCPASAPCYLQGHLEWLEVVPEQGLDVETFNKFGTGPLKGYSHEDGKPQQGWVSGNVSVPGNYKKSDVSLKIDNKQVGVNYDGSFKSENLDPGTYKWEAYLNDKTQSLNGTVTVEAGKQADLKIELDVLQGKVTIHPQNRLGKPLRNTGGNFLFKRTDLGSSDEFSYWHGGWTAANLTGDYGDYEVRYGGSGEYFPSAPQRFSIPGKNSNDVVVYLQRKEVNGRVFLPSMGSYNVGQGLTVKVYDRYNRQVNEAPVTDSWYQVVRLDNGRYRFELSGDYINTVSRYVDVNNREVDGISFSPTLKQAHARVEIVVPGNENFDGGKIRVTYNGRTEERRYDGSKFYDLGVVQPGEISVKLIDQNGKNVGNGVASVFPGDYKTVQAVVSDSLATYKGEVKDEFGKPIVGVDVTVNGKTAQTDGRGQFIVNGVKPTAKVNVKVADTDYTEELTDTVPGNSTDSSTVYEFTDPLQPRFKTRNLRLQFLSDGTGVPGIKWAVTPDPNHRVKDAQPRAGITEGPGYVEQVLYPGNYYLTLTSPKGDLGDMYTFEDAPRTVNIDSRTNMPVREVSLRKNPGRITGRVVYDNNEPVANALVRAGLEATRTNSAGYYTLDRVAAGTDLVTVDDAADRSYAGASKAITALKPAQAQSLDNITVSRATSRIEGTVTIDGKPARGGVLLEVRGKGSNSGYTRNVGADLNGNFSFVSTSKAKLFPGEYEVTVMNPDNNRYFGMSKSVTVKAGQPAKVNFDLKENRAPIVATVRNEAGELVSGAKLNIAGVDTRWTEGPTGVYTSDKLPAGDYIVKVEASDNHGYAVGPVTVNWAQTARTSFTVTRTAGTVTINVTDDDGQPVSGVSVKLEGRQFDLDKTPINRGATIADGKAVFESVPVGTYKVSVEGSAVYDEAAPIEFQVNAADAIDRTIELRRKDVSMQVVVRDVVKQREIKKPVIKAIDANGKVTTATGDDKGMYTFDGLRPGTYTVEVEPTERHKGGSKSGVVLLPGAETDPTFVFVENRKATVNGTVVDENGNPVAGATIHVKSNGTEEVVTSGEDGTFGVEGLSEGNSSFEVQPSSEYTGNNLTVTELQPGETRNGVIIEVTRDLKRLNGSVLDDGGNAIEGVEAQLIQGGKAIRTQSTDQDGGFAFDKMEPGTYTVKVEQTGTHLAGESERFEIVLGQGTNPVQVILQRKPGSLKGMVEFSNNKFVEGAEIRLVPHTGDPIDLTWNDEGKIVVPELPADTYKVEVTSPKNYKRVSVPALTVDPAKEADLGLIKFIAEIGEVAGAVRDENGEPVGNVRVKLHRPGQQPIDAVSAEDGTFSFTKVPVGEYTVDVAQPEKFLPVRDLKATVNPAEETALNIELEAKPTKGTIKGKVEDEAGNPVANVGISLEPTTGKGKTIDVSVAEDGTFDDATIPAGSYSLTVTQPVGYESVENIPVRIDAGKERVVPTITLKKSAEKAETGSFIGGVYDKATGAPLPQTGLVLVGAAGRYPVAINADGTFRRDGIPSGNYQLKIAQPEGYREPAAISVVIETGTDNYAQDITLEKLPVETTPTTGALQGSVLGLNEGKPVDPISGAKVNILRLGGSSTQVTTNASGIFTATGLEPGEYVVQVDAPNGYNAPRYERVVVSAGRTNDGVSIYLNRKPTPNPKPGAAAGTISGWLLDDGNYSIKGGTMRITGTAKHKDGTPRLDEHGKPIETLPAVKIGKDGYFTTDRLEPGDYTIDIDVPEGWPKPKGWPKKVTVTEDKAVELGFVTVKAPRSNVEGVIDDGTGKPVEGVIVTATDSRGKTTKVSTDKDGKFVFDKALPGTTTIEVFTPQGIQNVDPMYVPVKPGKDAAIPSVHLTEKQLKLSKRIRGYDADDLDSAPILPEDWDLVYGFLITNETDEVITGITLDDPFLGDTKVVKPKDFKGALAPGEHVFFSAVMPPQKGMSVVNNIAAVHGKNSKGQMVASTPNNAVARIGSASVEKKVNARFGVNKDKPVSLDVDEDMYFTYEIMNRGSAPMYNVTLTDQVCEWNEGKTESESENCKPMEIDLPSDWNRTLLPGERVFLSAVLPPLKPGTRHHNKALVKADLDQPRRSPGIKEESGIFEEDPPSILTVSPNKNSRGNAHVIVSEGKPLLGNIAGQLSGLPVGVLAGAKVELISEDNKTSLSATVDGNGKFAYGKVTPGKYKLRVTNPSDDTMKLGGKYGISTEQAAKGGKITTKLFEVTTEGTTNIDIPFVKVEAPKAGSSLGRCITETSSASNPAMYLIPLGLLVGAMAGSLVIYEDQFNAVVKQFNQAMPQLAIERPAWMNQISRQLEQLHPAAGPGVLAVILVAVGAIAVGLAYAACEAGVDGSSKGGNTGSKEKAA